MKLDPMNAKPVLEALKQRYSCRDFADKPVDQALIDDLIDTGLMAASGGNLQPYHIIVVRDPEIKRELRRLGGGQMFVEKADVLLVFVLDWSRYAVYTRMKHAPFRANEQLLHLVIGIEDVICAAQTVESCAYLSGLGSCYVGGVLETGADISSLLGLPQGCFPIVMLAMGYPAPGSNHKPSKLRRDMMVSYERYQPKTQEDIFEAYEDKYRAMDRHSLPHGAEAQDKVLKKLLENLRLTYPEDTAMAYLDEICSNGGYNEAQRRYGIHYGVATIRERSRQMLDGMRQVGCDPLKTLAEE